MDKLREEYQTSLRNALIMFLHEKGFSMTDIAGVFGVDKATISRVIQVQKDNPPVDRTVLIQLRKFFK